MKKILFAIGSMQIGGAETVLVDILNKIHNKFDITLFLIDYSGPLLDKIPKDIRIKSLVGNHSKFKRIKKSIIYRLLYKRRLYIKYIYKKILKDDYDVEIAFLAGITSEIIGRSINKKSKKLVWIHGEINDPNNEIYINIVNKFDKIIAVSQKSMDVFKHTYPQSKEKIELIYNYINIDKIINNSNKTEITNYQKDKINIVSVGRICKEKAYDRIINVAKNYEYKVFFNIIGDGIDKEKLLDNIKEKNVNNINLLGLKKNPYPYIKTADAFLLSSRSEAYPTVVLEAMILKKFIIATDVPGVREILDDYDAKIIVENSLEGVKEGINFYIKNKNKKYNYDNSFFLKENNKRIKKVIDLLNK